MAFEEGIKYTVYCIAKIGGFQYFYWICSLWLLLHATLDLCMVWIKFKDSIYHPCQNDDQVSVWQISFSLSFSTSALTLLAASVAKKRGGLSSQRKYVDKLVVTAFESAGVALDCWEFLLEDWKALQTKANSAVLLLISSICAAAGQEM